MNDRCAGQMLFLSIFCVLFAGCFSAKPENIKAFTRPYEAQVTADKYILLPPDEVEIFCTKIPEIDKQRQKIRPDGYISVEGLGEIKVAGLSAGEVSEILKEKASKLYSLPADKPIDFRIFIYRSQFFYVVGEVRKPGPPPYTGRDSVLHAITEAYPEVTGWKDKIQIVRPSYHPLEQKPKVFQVNYNKMVMHGDLSKDVLLQPGDIIYVPPTVLSAIAMVIEEFTRPIGRALAPVQSITVIQATSGP